MWPGRNTVATDVGQNQEAGAAAFPRAGESAGLAADHSNGKPTPEGGAGQPSASPPTPLPRRRRPATIALAVAMIALGGITGAWLLTRAGDAETALVLAAEVARGEELQANDLTSVELPVDVLNLRTVPSSSLDEVVGSVATADLLPGAVLTPDSFTAELLPGPGNAVVGVALAGTQMPSRPLAAGDQVRFVATPQVGGEMPAADPETVEAVVINAQPAEAGWLVNVELPSTEAPRLAALSATTRIALVIDTVG